RWRSTLNTILLVYALRRTLSWIAMTNFANTLLILAPAALLAGGIAATLAWLWEQHLGHRTFPLKLGAVCLPGAVAGLVYWIVALFGGVPVAGEILVLL